MAEHKKYLEELIKRPGNGVCADCGKESMYWARLTSYSTSTQLTGYDFDGWHMKYINNSSIAASFLIEITMTS